jgi:hypothetical protein
MRIILLGAGPFYPIENEPGFVTSPNPAIAVKDEPFSSITVEPYPVLILDHESSRKKVLSQFNRWVVSHTLLSRVAVCKLVGRAIGSPLLPFVATNLIVGGAIYRRLLPAIPPTTVACQAKQRGNRDAAFRSDALPFAPNIGVIEFNLCCSLPIRDKG